MAYRQLQENLDQLNQQLEEKNSELLENLLELDQTKNFLASILNSISSGVIAVDLAGKLTVFNRAAEEILGYRAADFLGRPYQELPIHQRTRKKGAEYPLTTTLEGGRQSGDRYLIAFDQERIPVRFSTNVITTPEGKVLGAVEIFEDVSELKLLEERVARNRTLSALGEMAANVAHELRNPLGGIGGFAALLDEMLEDNEEARRFVRKIIEGVDSLNKIATNLLAYTRPVEIKFYRGDLRLILKEVISYVTIELMQSGTQITLRERLPKKPVELEYDPELLRQSFLNLLKNAAQAVDPEKGVITISMTRKKSQKSVVVKIRDNGGGIPEHLHRKLFNPFFTTKTRGTGLGLPIARKNVELHNGTITFQSSPETGTTFIVEIPSNP